MKKSERLDPVMRVASHREEQEARRLGGVQQQLQREERRLADLTKYRDEYIKRYTATAQAGMTTTQMRTFQSFMAKLDEVIGQQTAVIERLRRDYAEQKAQWLAARNKTQALDKVVDHYRVEEQRDEDRRTQKEQDDRHRKPED